jgi:hypothetical protein
MGAQLAWIAHLILIEEVKEGLDKALKVFGIIIFLFGLFLLLRNPIAGLIVMFIGILILICYSGSRSGRDGKISGNYERLRQQAYWNAYLNPNNPNNPNSVWQYY